MTRVHRVSCGDKISILSGKCKLENSHPQFKTTLARSHISLPSSSPCGDKIFIVSEKCKLKTRTHMGKLAATWENLQHVLAMAASGHGFRKLIRLLENAVAMAV